MMLRCPDWPPVLPDDDGIRPAGRPAACFYCGAAVGARHGPDCVTVVSRWRCVVTVNGVRAGVYADYYPVVRHLGL